MNTENEPKMPDAEAPKALPRVRKPKAAKKVVKKAKRPVPKKKAPKRSVPKKNAAKVAKKPKAKKAVKKAKRPAAAATVERCERVDLRLSKVEKAKLRAMAKKLRRTITSILLEAIEKLKTR